MHKIDEAKRGAFRALRIGTDPWVTPVTPECLQDVGLLSALTRWRGENMEGFPSVFTPTVERTRTWLRDRILDKPGRCLFLIYSDTRPIGQVGVSIVDYETVEISDVIRGEVAEPGTMQAALHSLRQWLYRAGTTYTQLRVFTDRFHAIRLYDQLDFRPTILIPLARTETSQGKYAWTDADGRRPERYFLLMRHAG